MRTLLIITLAFSVMFASFAVADGKKHRKPDQTTTQQVQPAHLSRQTCSPPQARRQPQGQHEAPRREVHRDHHHHGGFLGQVGRFLGEVARTPVYYYPQYPVYQPTYGGYGYSRVGSACVVATNNNTAMINRGAANSVLVGMQFVVWGRPATDPYTHVPLPDTAKIVCWLRTVEVFASSSTCVIDWGCCGRSDIIAPAPVTSPVGY